MSAASTPNVADLTAAAKDPARHRLDLALAPTVIQACRQEHGVTPLSRHRGCSPVFDTRSMHLARGRSLGRELQAGSGRATHGRPSHRAAKGCPRPRTWPRQGRPCHRARQTGLRAAPLVGWCPLAAATHCPPNAGSEMGAPDPSPGDPDLRPPVVGRPLCHAKPRSSEGEEGEEGREGMGAAAGSFCALQ